MKRIALIVAGLGTSLVLAACGGGTVTPPPPPTPDEEISLGSGSSHFYETGESRLYYVNAGLGSDLIHVELDRDVMLEVADESYLLEFTSSSRDFFGRGTAGLGPAAIGSSAITEERNCNGSCIVFRPFGDFVVQVTNDSGSSAQIDLDVFGTSFRDSTEPFNFDTVSPPLIPAGSFDKGAIETVGDEDYWEVPSTAQVIFSPQAFPTEAHVVDSSGQQLVELTPGVATTVFEGEYVRVRAENPERAAIVGLSGYTLEHGTFTTSVTRERGARDGFDAN